MGVVADRSRTPLAGTDCKGELERESRRVRARGLSRGNRYSRALASRRRLWILYGCQANDVYPSISKWRHGVWHGLREDVDSRQ